MSISYSKLRKIKEKSGLKCSECGEYMYHAEYSCREEYQTWCEDGYHCKHCAEKPHYKDN